MKTVHLTDERFAQVFSETCAREERAKNPPKSPGRRKRVPGKYSRALMETVGPNLASIRDSVVGPGARFASGGYLRSNSETRCVFKASVATIEEIRKSGHVRDYAADGIGLSSGGQGGVRILPSRHFAGDCIKFAAGAAGESNVHILSFDLNVWKRLAEYSLEARVEHLMDPDALALLLKPGPVIKKGYTWAVEGGSLAGPAKRHEFRERRDLKAARAGMPWDSAELHVVPRAPKVGVFHRSETVRTFVLTLVR